MKQRLPASVERYWRAVIERDVEGIDEVLTEDFSEEWPQSGERILGADAWKQVVSRHPAYPRVTVRRLIAAEDLAVCEADFDYGDGQPWRICSVMELRGGQIARISQYFGAPFPAAEWRNGITERI